MATPAILGIYKDGPDTKVPEEAIGKWSPWRIPSSSPRKVWEDLKPFLEEEIAKSGYFHMYVYFGDDINVEYVYRVDAVHISAALTTSPGTTFPESENVQAHVWIHYAKLEKLKKTIARSEFGELVLVQGKLGAPIKPISEAGWFKSSRTGLVLVADPKR